MESISRPPHRRKHSTSTNASSSSSYSSFSFRNPYDAVLLSKGRKPTLEAPEYAEIFAGSPSIPVLEIPGLRERVGPSKPDYATIFGGWRGDDVAVPYEQLFSGALQKTKTRNPSVVESPFHEPGYVNSPEETKRSSGASDQSIDGIKQQYNMSFSRFSQRNSNESNGKTHVAQLHAVPGFTHFVDGTPHLQKKDNVEPVHSVQRKVSRTWSFNSGVELTKINGVNASGKVNGINIKSHVSLSNTNDNKDLRQSRLPAIAAKDDSKSNDGEYSPPFLYEELDENSVAAVSAATLKKAIEQAQESIRIAKMVMEKRKEGFKDGSKPMSKSCLKVKDKKKTKVHNLSDSKDNNVRATCEKLDPTVSMPNEVYGSFGPAMSHSDSCVNSGKSKVETVTEDVDVANYPTEAFTYMGKNFAPSSSESEMLYNEEDDVENVEQNVAATEPHGDTANSTGLVVNAKCRAVAFESGTVEHIDPSTCSRNKVEPPVAQTETSMENLEQRELIVQSKGPNIVSETEESSPYSSQSVVESLDQCPDINACIKGPESITEQLERALHCSESKQEQEIMQEGGNMRASLTECDGDVGKENCWKKSPECEELVSMNNAKVLKLEFANLQTGLILAKKDTTEKADLDKKAENVSEWKENVQDGRSSGEEENLMLLQEHHKWFESELQWSESIEEEISQPKPEIHQEAEVENISDVVCELEIVDRKLNCEHDEDEGKKPGEDGWNEVEDRCRDISEQEAAENMQMETDISQIPWDVDEITDSYERTRSEENQDKIEFQVVASIRDADEVIDTCCNDSDAFFSNSPRNNTSTVFTKTQESCDVDLNYRAEVYQAADRGFKENDSLPLESEILSEVEDNGVGKAVDLEVNKMLRADGFPTCASEGNYFTSSQRKSTIEELSSDNRCVNVDSMDVDHEAVLPKAEEIFETASEIYNASEERTAKINMINLTEFYTDDDKVTEFDSTNVNPVLEQSCESHEELLWTSTFENVDEVSTPESQACSVNPKDNISHKEEGKDYVSSFDENDNIGEHDYKLNSKDERRDSSTQSHGDSQEMDKFTEAEREVGTGQNIKKNENPCGIPTMGPKVATGNQKFEANDYLQRIEAIKRGREREKDRIVVERAIREARERAFVEARERAERAAVERAATEARQRAMAEAREKLDKASVENKLPADKVYNEAKLRAERAAVDRATAEARERALEKAMSQKTYTEARTQTEKLSTERFSTSSRNGLKHSFSSSDLDKFDGTSSESAQRRKARLERHQRIMERAAKALAEKNIRDVLAQKEQAERNRLAESLDADIKRWSTGKESNLRALLSTLQYILGPDSGWQPLSLTEMITAAAVKKAYRKATLCVHPDKLQQRGASIQQKYICEKVFDLLKAAWNRFNSEER